MEVLNPDKETKFKLVKLYVEGKKQDLFYRFLEINCSEMEEILNKISTHESIKEFQCLNCVYEEGKKEDIEKNLSEKLVPIINSKFSLNCHIKITYCNELELEDLNPENDNTLFILEKKANQPEAYVTVQSYPLEWFSS